ncbi:MAG: ABC transporter permease [Actinomyces sp.]|jgi:ribose transport system permease protein|nr:ABC transporter permease [Actinomyces sp.]MCI1642505.1 ABC transporter permease [Actinomyces sp.]MCI1663062.1 ABC transporter permease [Actinomyces sp.]MCI1691700.1 ABC transporter permease [Actinomyces sp.]
MMAVGVLDRSDPNAAEVPGEQQARPPAGGPRASRVARWGRSLLALGRPRTASARVVFLLVVIVLVVTMSARSQAFLTASNLRNVAEGSVTLLVVALAMTLVVRSGGIDLSVGTSLDVGAWVVILAMTGLHLGWGGSILVALAAALAVGGLNALLIARLGVSPFLATLGVYFVGRSVQQVGTGGGANVSFRNAPDAFHQFGVGSVAGIPYKVLIAVAVALVVWALLARTTFGRRVDAIGLQTEAARTVGIPVRRDTAVIYLVASVLCALAGVMLTAGLRIYTPHAGFTYQTDAIAATFLGAALHPHGRPNVPGTLAAVLFLEVLSNGLDLLGIDFNLKALIRGAVLVLALALSFGLARRGLGRGVRA